MSIKISPAKRLDQFEEYYFSKKLREVAKLIAAGKPIINLGIGSPDLVPPKVAINQLTEASNQKGAHQYQSYRGIPTFRNAIADWYQKHFDVHLNPENELLPLIGSKEGIFHLSMAFLDVGDTVLIPDPGYPAYANCAKLVGAKIQTYDLLDSNNWLPDFDAIEKQLMPNTKMMWVNYPHMPSGTAANLELFEKLVAFGHRHNILICHDNPYAFILTEKPVSIFQVEAARSVAVELNSLSKTYNMAGWRVGFLAGAAEFIQATQQVSSNLGSGMFKSVQMAAAAALQVGDNWFVNQNEIYLKRKKIGTAILEHLGCEVRGDQVGLFIWGKVPEDIGNITEWLDELLYERNIFLTPGHIFGKNGNDYVRLSICNTVEVLETALARLSDWYST